MSGEFEGPRWWQRPARWLARSGPGAWLLSRTLHHVDRFVLSLTDGEVVLAEVLAGIPVVELTTTGARSGEERTVPVLGLRDDDRWVMIASNWGQEHHPAWYHNLRANPEVTVRNGDEVGRYEARTATGEERERLWDRAATVYAGFEVYRRRSGDRPIPVVVLEPTDEDAGDGGAAADGAGGGDVSDGAGGGDAADEGPAGAVD